MNDARLIINVSDTTFSHHNGLAGNYIVPAKQAGEQFGLLVVYSAREIQDVGTNKPTVHWPSATSVAEDILARYSDSTAHVLGERGGAEKWGIYLCEANPDIPRDLLEAEEEQIRFLGKHRPKIEQARDPQTKMMLATTIWRPEEEKKIIELSERVAALRTKFQADCRKLVMKDEISKAKQFMQKEDQRLVSEGDFLWAGNEASRRNISELHKGACRRLRQTRPWSYEAEQLVECPGCGAKIKENILTCPHCLGQFDDDIEVIRALPARQRSQRMYPERAAEVAGRKG